MAIFRKIHTFFWSDPFIDDLDRDYKLFYLYLLTNEKTRQCGIYEITKKQIAYDLGYTIDTVSKHLEYFIKCGKIRYNETTKEIAIGKWLKYNDSTSPKVKTCIDKEFGLVKDTLLIDYVKSMDTQPQEEQEQEQESEQEEEKEPEQQIISGKKPVHPSYGFIKECFLAYYLKEKKDSYYFKPIDGKKINSIIEQLKFKISEKNTRENITLEEDKLPEQINLGFEYLLGNINDDWIKENLSLAIIDSKFNEIISKIINNGKDGKPKRLVDEAGERLRNNQYS
jgi:hypothetical protein